MSRRARNPPCAASALLTAALVLAPGAAPLARAADGAVAPSPASVAASPEAGLLQKIDVEQKIGQQIPLDLPFRDEDGRSVELAELFTGRPVVLTMVYYECPMLCTLVLNGVVRAIRALPFDVGDEFDIVTVSFDPGEGPELAAAKKRAYLDHYGRPEAAGGWHFLTGEQDAIDRLTDAVGFRYAYDPERDEYAHAAAIMVVTPEGKLARYFFGVEYPAKDLRLGLVEASAGKLGSVVDRLLLYCYHYDPSTGRYSAAALNLVRAGGAVTVLAMLLAFATWRRREKHAARRDA